MTDAHPDQRPMMISDPQVMRALAHPARLAIIEHLSSTGAEVTATECAEVAGLSPSATSYHLRALAKAGMIEEAPSRGDARERVWRSAVRSWGVNAGPTADPEVKSAERTLIEAYLARDIERSREWLRRAADEPTEWYDAAWLSDSVLLLTAEELTALNQAVRELTEPYQRRNRIGNPPAGARTVSVQYKALPMN